MVDHQVEEDQAAEECLVEEVHPLQEVLPWHQDQQHILPHNNRLLQDKECLAEADLGRL